MTYEEAIFLVRENIKNDYTQMIVEALEKQIPKKPELDRYGIPCICPHCHGKLDTIRPYTDEWGRKTCKSVSPEFCDKCGQALQSAHR